jgi:hypothetical protein
MLKKILRFLGAKAHRVHLSRSRKTTVTYLDPVQQKKWTDPKKKDRSKKMDRSRPVGPIATLVEFGLG